MNTVEFITSFLGGSAILISGVAYLTKSLISQFLIKEIENHKSQLQLQNQKTLSEFNAIIERLAHEHQIKFNLLHEKRAEVIAETYSLIRDVYNRVTAFCGNNGNTSENLQKVEEAIERLNDYYPRRRIFISYDVANKVDRLRTELSWLAQEVNAAGVEYDFTKMYDRVYGDISSALTSLEENFRILLGEDLTNKSADS